MKILFVTSIVYPDIGGPALYARHLPKELEKIGIFSEVLCLPKLKRPLREFVYTLKLFYKILGYDIVYALSASPMVTLPALLMAKIFRKKFLLRPGGDFLWERDIEKGITNRSLTEYYIRGDHKKHLFAYRIFYFVLRGAHRIIFPTIFLKNLYKEHFTILEEKCAVVDYPYPEIPISILSRGGENYREKQFLFAGRLIRFKNIDRLIRAFASINDKKGFKLKIVGSGTQKEQIISLIKSLSAEEDIIFQDTLPHEELLTEISKSYCVVIPSIFEPGSFLALECLKLKTPVIFTKEAGLYDRYSDKLLFIDPKSQEDIREKMEFLMVENNYAEYISTISSLDTTRGWEDVAREHIEIFKKV